MANLTTGRDADRQEGVLVDVAHGDNIIYRGGIVTIDADTGYAHAGKANEAVIGIAMEDTPTDGRKYIRVYTEGVVQVNGSGFTQADVGKLVTVSDDNSVAIDGDSTDANKILGKIISIEGTTSVRVKL